MKQDRTPTEAERVADLQQQAAADYAAAQDPARQAEARTQRALAIGHAQESAAANTRR
ncbi:hypothetical protein LUW75_10770 [Streptomyces sp. MRC013]|uniref:hypothetical protein n=1 Tax=Streptomyces sp. MRC013 TaxID=2898276 RepID=UPI002026F70F|nr:hypothetical protein [Streptomyces sp. MRC013]URM90396.1 hypothetical protein LUW75_10770 [Streptomyces sp. MRC013]